MHTLQTVAEHGAIFLVKNVLPDLDPIVVWFYSKEVCIKRCVVNLAEGEPVTHLLRTLGLSVRDDMAGVEEFAMAEPA
jgi:hypothetical protein